MTLDELILKITEAENSISIEIEKGRFDFAVDYLNYAQEYLRQIMELKPTLSKEELLKAQDFASQYAEHIKEQVKLLAVERAKTSEQYRDTRVRHNIAGKYSKVKKATAYSSNKSSFSKTS